MNDAIVRLDNCLEYLRKNVQENWQIQQIMAFITIAKRHPDGITLIELGESMGTG